MTKNENSSQIIPAVKHQWQTFAKKQMKVGCKVHHITNFIDTLMNYFPHGSFNSDSITNSLINSVS